MRSVGDAIRRALGKRLAPFPMHRTRLKHRKSWHATKSGPGRVHRNGSSECRQIVPGGPGTYRAASPQQLVNQARLDGRPTNCVHVDELVAA